MVSCQLGKFVSTSPQRGGSNTKSGRPWHFRISPPKIYCNFSVDERPHEWDGNARAYQSKSLVADVFTLHLKAWEHRNLISHGMAIIWALTIA